MSPLSSTPKRTQNVNVGSRDNEHHEEGRSTMTQMGNADPDETQDLQLLATVPSEIYNSEEDFQEIPVSQSKCKKDNKGRCKNRK